MFAGVGGIGQMFEGVGGIGHERMQEWVVLVKCLRKLVGLIKSVCRSGWNWS